ncbi:nascent polypeptide-associated complex subunit alpha, muscle-specific form-like [Triticum dicoccoides]|uniref:nascent polypeptide-associated complex subunit alpha, muscle-specific form-like n=1 Tax=Triticum dicoccoides TaxID=85692 RepID=UPI001891E816|nr:nascent polypeptide-associated complex subunit alpha, muscle-specific form-like [Triticum dicoccoides]
MMAADLHRSFFLAPSPHHLAELRIDPQHSAVTFSAPGGVAGPGGRKRRCLLPPVSPRKKLLVELHPFDSSPSPSQPPSPRLSPSTAPPLLSRTGSPAGDFSFPSVRPCIGGSGGGNGGNIFAFLEDTPSTPSPTGSGVSALSFLAPPGQPTTPTGGTLSGGLTFMDSPQKPTAGPTANGGFMFSASPEQPLTPANSPAGGGLASLSTEPSLSPREYHGGCAVASFPSPKHAHTGSTDSGGLAFFPSPGPPIGHASSPTSPSFVFSASKILAPLVRKSGGDRKKRPRRQQGIVSTLRGSQQAIEPPQKVVKTYASVTAGETSRSSIQSGSSARPCCTFFTSPAKATPANGETSRSSGKQEARKACSEASSSTSPCGSGSTFVPAPAKHSSAGKASKQHREVEVSSVATPAAPAAACTGAEVVVRVTCACGVHKEFCFDHRH